MYIAGRVVLVITPPWKPGFDWFYYSAQRKPCLRHSIQNIKHSIGGLIPAATIAPSLRDWFFGNLKVCPAYLVFDLNEKQNYGTICV